MKLPRLKLPKTPKATTIHELPNCTIANETPKEIGKAVPLFFLIWLRWRVYKE
jgi:hypothetical protein